MPWPLSQDYNEALQSPQSSFRDPELRQGQVVVNALGIPQPCSGNFADVYAVECPATKSKWAVKCFTREVHGLRERYREISSYLQQVRLPFTVDFQYLEQGIRIAGRWYPILKMHWVEGFTLNAFVRDMLDKPAMLEKLSRIWVRLAHRLREAKLTHCDLQHGNVLLVPDSEAHALAVKLIDYDGMWVPALAKTPSGEFGHPAYQHPRRLHDSVYDAEVDRFPLLAVHVALRALIAGGRQLWERYDTGDNLLFRQSDFEAPSKSPLFDELLRMNKPELRDPVVKLIDAARMSLEQTPHLADLVDDEKPIKSPVAKSQPSPAIHQPAVQAKDTNPFRDLAPSDKARRRGGSLFPWIATGVVAAFAVVGGALLWGLQAGGSSQKPSTQPALAHTESETTATAPNDPGPPAPNEEQPPAQVDKNDSPSEKRPQRGNPPPPPDKPTSAPKKQKALSLPAGASIADLRRALTSEEPALREVAAARLARLGPSAEPALDDLATALSDEKNAVQVRRNAALALAHMGSAAKKAVPALAKALSRTQPVEVRQYAAEALAKIEYPANDRAIPAILDALQNDNDPTVRHRCVWALHKLQEIKTNGADKILESILGDTNPRMLYARYDAARKLAWTLREESPDKTADVLLEMLKNKTIKVYGGTDVKVDETSKTPASSRTNVRPNVGGDARFFAAEALAWLGKKASRRKDILDALKRATTDADPKLRQAAAAALKSLDVPGAATAAPPSQKQTLKGGKLPVPDEEELKKATEDIRDIYKAEYASHDPTELAVLAERLLQRGRRSFEPAERRYVCLYETGSVAAKAGDSALSIRAIEELGRLFAIEQLPMKTAFVQETVKHLRTLDASKTLLESCFALLAEAILADDYEDAERLVKTAEIAAYKLGLPRSSLQPSIRKVQRLKAKYMAIQPALSTLAMQPTDREANRIVGIFRCFEKGDWENGLPLLILSEDARLKDLAQKDQEAPATAEERSALGDRWWALAQERSKEPAKARPKELAKANIQQRACYWYERALPSAGDQARADIEKHIRQHNLNNPLVCWGDLDISQADLMLGALRLPKGNRAITTLASYAGPIEVRALACTEKNNIRLRAGKGACVIFNWERKRKELRVTRPDGTERAESGSLATAAVEPLKPNTWYLLAWRITEEGMSVSVNERVVFSEQHKNDLSERHPLSINSTDSAIEVLAFTVRPIRKRSN
jgi:hypothetical protein